MAISEVGLRKKIGTLADNPVLWGGVGLLAGAMLSPVSTKWFIGFGGVLVWIAIVRGELFAAKKAAVRWGVNFLLLLALSAILLRAWRALPKPPEPLTRQDMYDAVKDGLASGHNTGSQTSGQIPGRSTRLASKAELAEAVREAVALLGRPSAVTVQVPAPSQSINPTPTTMPPVISSAPKMFGEGEIKGVNFGTARGKVAMRIRVKPSGRSGNYADHVGDLLLGGLTPANIVHVEDNFIQRWSDTSIQLKFRNGYKEDMISRINGIARSRSLDPPKESDLEVGYQIVSASGESEWFYPQDR